MTVGNTATQTGNPEGQFQMGAQQYCAAKVPGASLVTINDARENTFLYEWALSTRHQPEPVWIGLRTNAMGQWEWLSGEPFNYSNWDMTQYSGGPLEPGTGAMLFDADPVLQGFNAAETTAQWVPEEPLNNEHFFICEYHPHGMTRPTMMPGTGRPFTTMSPFGTTPGFGQPGVNQPGGAPRQPGQPGFGQPTQPRQPGQPGFGQPNQPQQPGRPGPNQPAIISNPRFGPQLLQGGRFGGSLLHEVPRRNQRPSNMRNGPYVGVMP